MIFINKTYMGSNNIINEEVSRMKSLFGYQRGRVISEQGLAGNASTGQASGGQTYSNTSVDPQQQKRIANIGATYASVKNGVITQPGFYNGKNWVDYITDQNVSSADLAAAKELNKQNQAVQQTQNTRMQNIVNTINQIDPETATIKSTNKNINGMSFDAYRKRFNVSQTDIEQAKAYVANLAKTQPEQAEKALEVLSTVSSAPGSVQAPAGGTKAPVAGTTAKSKPEVIELQKQLKAAGYNLGTSGPNRDGVDGIMGPKTRAAQQQMVQQKGNDAFKAISKQGQDLQNKWSSYGKMTPEQIANANALKAGQPLPQTKAPVTPAAPAAPVPTGPKPTGLGFANEERDGWFYNANTKDWSTEPSY